MWNFLQTIHFYHIFKIKITVIRCIHYTVLARRSYIARQEAAQKADEFIKKFQDKTSLFKEWAVYFQALFVIFDMSFSQTKIPLVVPAEFLKIFWNMF